MLRGLIECWAPGREASAGTMDVFAYPAKLGNAHQSLIYKALANRDVAHALQDGNPGRVFLAGLRGTAALPDAILLFDAVSRS
jgi:hypothetical protein